MFKKTPTTLAILILILFCSFDALGQLPTASIRGTVTDSSGASVAGADIEVKNVRTGITQHLVTDSRGRYTANDVQIGDYEVRAQMKGFKTETQTSLTLAVGDQRIIDFTLRVGATTDVIEVKGYARTVDTASSTMSGLVDQKQITDLPLNGRSFNQLLLLAPGVQSTISTNGGAIYGRNNDYSISGSRPVGQTLILDGASIQNFWDHGTGSSIVGTSLGVDAISEFEVFTNTYGAQYGGNGGGLNAVTKSGTNDWHGSAYEFYRDSVFDARNYFDPPGSPPAFRRNQYGGTLGGPIQKSKSFFFVNYEGLRQNLGENSVNTIPNSAAAAGVLNPAVLAILQALPTPNGADNGNGTSQHLVVANLDAHQNYVSTRWDYNLDSSNSLFARYIFDRSNLQDPFADNPLGQYPDQGANHNQFPTLGWRKVISSSIINSAQFNFTRTLAIGGATNRIPAFNFVPQSPMDAFVFVNGLSFLGNIGNLFVFAQNKFEGKDQLSWVRGGHSLTIGASVERIQSNVTLDAGTGGFFFFSSFGFNPGGGAPAPGSFLSGEPSLFLGNEPPNTDAIRGFRNINVTGFVQDDWRVNSRLSVNLGLRYAFLSNPIEVNSKLTAILDIATATDFSPVSHVFVSNPSLRNFDPRIGIAWALTGDGKTAVRAGFGIFHDVITARTFSGYALNPPYIAETLVAPIFDSPFTFHGLNVALPTTSESPDYNIDRTPYVIQFNANLQHEFGGGFIATVAYVGSRGVRLFYQNEINPPLLTPGSTPQNPVFTDALGNMNPRINPNFSNVDVLMPGAHSNYNALQASLDKRFTHGLQVQAFYTFSKCIDDSSASYPLEGDAGGPENPYSLATDRGLCSFDARHNFTSNLLYTLPFHGNRFVEGWEISNIVTAQSGHPFNAIIGFDQSAVGESLTVDRPSLAPGRSLGSIVTGNPSRWFDPTAFVLPSPGHLGNLPRNAIAGPNLVTTDLAIIKNTRISERLNVQLRAEAFNLFNHPNFSPPGVFSAGHSVFADSTGAINPVAGQLTSTTTTSRQLQLAIKLTF